jgi:hypothetical protein
VSAKNLGSHEKGQGLKTDHGPFYLQGMRLLYSRKWAYINRLLRLVRADPASAEDGRTEATRRPFLLCIVQLPELPSCINRRSEAAYGLAIKDLARVYEALI